MTAEDLVLSDRYRLTERLAIGGMGEVWKAEDELLARTVAVKLLRREFVSDDTARSRFRSEARYAASLHDGGIAQVYDYGEHGEHVYLVMELVTGEPLSRILRRTGRLSPEVTLDIVGQAARALHAAHHAGIVHRDVKPANLMITNDGVLKITDFGIARTLQAAAASITGTGMVMGTAQYVSPEQASGRNLTPATDLYSLGVVAYECLSGGPPFAADTPVAIALMHVRDEPPSLDEDMPPAVQDLITELLAKDPADRPASGRALADRAFVIRESLMLGDALEVSDGTDGNDDDPTGVLPFGRSSASRTARMSKAGGGSRSGTPGDGTGGAEPGEHEDGLGERSALFFTSIAVGVLLLGVIVVGSLWKLPDHSGGITGNTAVRHVPSEPAHPGKSGGPNGGTIGPTPSGASTAPASAVSTSPTPRTSSSGKASSTPTPTAPSTSSPPHHTVTPTPTPSTTLAPTPTPSPPSIAPGALGSDTKV